MTLGSVEDAVFFLMAIPAAALWTSFDIPLLNEVLFALKEKLSVVLLVACCLLLFIIILKTFSKRYQELFKSSGFINKVTQKITNIWQDFSTVYKLIGQKGKIWFLASLFLTSIQWICRYSVISALLAGLSLPVDIVKFFLFQWLVFTLTTFIPSPGGAGGAETAFFYIFSGIIPRELLALTTTAWRFLTFYFQLSLGSIVFGYTNFKKLAKK
jgi:hypothetical protein